MQTAVGRLAVIVNRGGVGRGVGGGECKQMLNNGRHGSTNLSSETVTAVEYMEVQIRAHLSDLSAVKNEVVSDCRMLNYDESMFLEPRWPSRYQIGRERHSSPPLWRSTFIPNVLHH